jgi:hypothetical protein
MARSAEVDELIRAAFEAEGVDGLDLVAEPSLPEMVTELFRGHLRWIGGLFMIMILVFFIVTVFCGLRFLDAREVPDMIRWGAGFFFGLVAVLAGKIWYWMEIERLTMTREIKRVELMVAHLASELRARS